MAKLVWDKSGERFFEAGVKYGVLYPMKDTHTENENTKYEAGVVWNGLTGVTETPEGAEPNDLWADNIKYATLYSAETFGATIEAYTYPDEFAQCDGSAVVSSGVYIGQQDRKSFGFCYRTKVGNDSGVEEYKIHIIYNAKASPSEKSYETINDSPDAITFSWEISTVPININVSGQNYKPCSTLVLDSKKLSDNAMSAVEAMLYGSENSEPTLPTPEQIMTEVAKWPNT